MPKLLIAILGVAVLAGGLLLAFLYLSRPSADMPADVIYQNGRVLTMDAENSEATAFAVRGDLIAGVGTNWYVSGWKGEETKVVDLEGKTVVPGFIDAHGHFPEAGVIALYRADLRSPPMGSVETMEDLKAVLAEKTAETPTGEWVVGVGYDDTLLEENRHPTKQDLDAVSTAHPIFVWHTSLHLGVANSLALEMAGITKRSLDTPGGAIHRAKGSGEPTGLLEEIPAMLPVLSQMPDPDLPTRLAAIEKAAEIYHAQGVTSAQTGYMDAASLPALLEAVTHRGVRLRLDVWPAAQVIKDWLVTGGVPNVAQTPFFRMKTAKIVGDGSIQGYTGYLSQPYHIPPEGKPDWRGYPAMPREQLIELVRDMHEAGFQVAVHGNGDAAIDDILAAFENLHADHVEQDLRPIIVHAQMARQDQLEAMAELGVIPSFFNLHTYYWGDRHRDIFMGPERAQRMSPLRSAEELGIRYTLHADTPVTPMEPMRMVWAAVNRKTTSGQVIGPDQTIDALEALRAITIDAAYQTFQEGEKGSIEAGKLADFVILSANPLETSDAELDDIVVLETVIGGKTVFRRNSGLD